MGNLGSEDENRPGGQQEKLFDILKATNSDAERVSLPVHQAAASSLLKSVPSFWLPPSVGGGPPGSNCRTWLCDCSQTCPTLTLSIRVAADAAARDTRCPGSVAAGSLRPAQCAVQCRNRATGRALPGSSAPSDRACLARHLSLLHP